MYILRKSNKGCYFSSPKIAFVIVLKPMNAKITEITQIAQPIVKTK